MENKDGCEDDKGRVIAILTPVEADLIRHLRKYRFGKGEIVIKNGKITMLHFMESKQLSLRGGMELEGSVMVTPGEEGAVINKLASIHVDEK